MPDWILHTDREDIAVEIVYSSRRTVGLQIKDCRVILRLPQCFPKSQIPVFLKKHQQWIVKHLEKVRAEMEETRRQTEAAALPWKAPGEMTPQEQEEMKHLFSLRVRELAEGMGVSYGRITLRDQKSRWGSCSSAGNLNFNYRLYYLSPQLRDYVIIHELSHRRHMDHSAEFWAEVERYCPDYVRLRAELKKIRIR